MFPFVGASSTARRGDRRCKWRLVCAAEAVVCFQLLTPSPMHVAASAAASAAVSRTLRRRHASGSALAPSARGGDDEAMSRGALQCLLSRCAVWNFDSFLLSRLSGGHPVVALGLRLFERSGLMPVFQLDWARLLLCLRLIERGYRDANHFHDSTHAADVAQAIFCFLNEDAVARALAPLEKLACLLAAFGHDLYHPGVNQRFLEATKHFLCPLYDNVSVLENFHWRCLLAILRESQLLDHLPAEQWTELLSLTKVLILATDIQRQQEYLDQFQSFLRSSDPAGYADSTSRRRLMQPALASGDLERLVVMQILIKCADIGNPCRPWRLSQEWSYRASLEFFSQGFMELIALPLFRDWDRYIKTELSAQMMKHLRTNSSRWKELLDREVRGGIVAPRQAAAPAGYPRPQLASLGAGPPTQRRRVSASILSGGVAGRSASAADVPRRVSLPTRFSGVTRWTVETSQLGVFHCESPADDDASSSGRAVVLHNPSADEGRCTRPSVSSTTSCGRTLDTLVDLSEDEDDADAAPLVGATVTFADNKSGSTDESADEAPTSVPTGRRHSEPAVVLQQQQLLLLAAAAEPQHRASFPLVSTALQHVGSLLSAELRARLPRRRSLPVSERHVELARLADNAARSAGSCSAASSASELCQLVGAS